MRLFFAAAVLVAASATAAEQTSPAYESGGVTVKDSSANSHLGAAIRLYQKLDLDAALAELQLAEAGARDNEDERVQVLIYRGLIFSETGKLNEASDQFKRALAIRPWAEVPPDTSPRIAKNFNDARKSLWGMANVKPPQKQAAPATTTTAPPAVQPAADKK
jgi:hypothetical protein